MLRAGPYIPVGCGDAEEVTSIFQDLVVLEHTEADAAVVRAETRPTGHGQRQLAVIMITLVFPDLVQPKAEA